MADFIVRVSSGVVTRSWTEPTGALPSRLNSTSGTAPIYLSASPLQAVQIVCTPDGLSEGAGDALLGGRLFTCAWIEWAGIVIPALYQPAGYTSQIKTAPIALGHYLLGIYRPDGGAIAIRFMCEAP